MPAWIGFCLSLLAVVVGPFAAAAGLARCEAHAFCVGPGEQFATVAAALAQVRAGGTIDVVAGTYRQSVKIARANVTLRGIGGRPHFDCTGVRPDENKACLLAAADGVTFDNLEVSGAAISADHGANAACIRNEPGISFTVRNVICHGSQDGVLSSGGTIAIDRSQFYDNGWDGLTHNVYFSGDCAVTVKDSSFRDARVGHEFKSRCLSTRIYDSTFRSSTGSRDLDIPDGGDTLVVRSVLIKTKDAADPEIVGFTPESCKHPDDMGLEDVRVINQRSGADIRNFDRCPGRAIILDGVRFEGVPVSLFGNIYER